MTTVNPRLRNERRKRALSQEEVAGRIGTTPGNVSRWERGITFPSPFYCRKLCDLFEVSPEELFPDTFEEIPASTPDGVALSNTINGSGAADDATSQQFVPSEMAMDTFQPSTVFLFNMALTDQREFFGRAREKTTLLSRVLKGESTSIVGPRRIGKSWLISYLRLIAPARLGTQYRLSYLDATSPSCATISGFASEALKGLGQSSPPSGIDAQTSLEMLETAIKELRAKDLIPILCIDEFEALCRLREFHLGVLENLRAMTQVGLGMVICTRRPIVDVVVESAGEHQRTSPFFNVFRQISLKPFTQPEALAFVQTKGAEAQFAEEERSYLLKYSKQKDTEQWLPLRLQLVGTLLQEDKVLAAQESPDFYRPNDPEYWQDFEERVEEVFQGVVG